MTRIGKFALAVVFGGFLIGIATGSTYAQSRTKPSTVPHLRNPIGLRITDTKGTIVTLLYDKGSITVDYTKYPPFGPYTPDYEYHGLRTISSGDGKILVTWDKLSRMDLTNFSPKGAEAQMVTTAGNTYSIVLVPWTGDGLEGATEIGKFLIDLNKVKSIEVIR